MRIAQLFSEPLKTFQPKWYKAAFDKGNLKFYKCISPEGEIIAKLKKNQLQKTSFDTRIIYIY